MFLGLRHLLNLVQLCACNEHHFSMVYHNTEDKFKMNQWPHFCFFNKQRQTYIIVFGNDLLSQSCSSGLRPSIPDFYGSRDQL